MAKDGVTIFRAAEEDMSQYGHVNSRNKKLMFQRMYVDDPDTGRHVVMMEGMTVESGDNDALAVVSVATVITCGNCLKRWMTPIAEYRQGWNSCPHCAANLFMPPVYGDRSNGVDQDRVVLPLRATAGGPQGTAAGATA